MTKTEYEGVAFTAMVHVEDGEVINVTERGVSSVVAYVNLRATIAEMRDDGFVPFVTYYNKAGTSGYNNEEEVNKDIDDAMVSVAKELGGVELSTHEIPDEHNFLGMKGKKPEEIKENDSYDILADTYTYDGTWVNFYNGSSDMSAAGHYYNTSVGEKIFLGMFNWQPALVEKQAIPGGSVLLYMLGVKGKKSSDIYHNIKAVEPA